jgi:dolichol-phosphate mannosyltransferase
VKLSVVVPAHNEEGCIESTACALVEALDTEGIDYEVLIINDGSTDRTEDFLQELTSRFPRLRYLNNEGPHGFGFAIRRGLEEFSGDAVAVFMADASDRTEDLLLFYHTMHKSGVDCVFGSRFLPGGKVVDYPKFKLVLNRMANRLIALLFGLSYNDTTNAFKMYRREVIDGLKPFLSHHFNLTIELPLKAIVRGYSYRVVPNWWINRKTGESKLKIKEMGSRYLFILLYCLIEKWLSRGDYHRNRLRPK